MGALTNLPDSATLISVFTLVVLLLGAPRYVRGARAKATLAEKDAVIETKQQVIDSQHSRLVQVDSDCKQALATLAKCQADVREWQARYDEQAKYTAEGALKELKEYIAEEFAERSELFRTMLANLTKFETALRTNSSATSELLIKNMEVMTRVDESLRHILARTDVLHGDDPGRSRIK